MSIGDMTVELIENQLFDLLLIVAGCIMDIYVCSNACTTLCITILKHKLIGSKMERIDNSKKEGEREGKEGIANNNFN